MRHRLARLAAVAGDDAARFEGALLIGTAAAAALLHVAAGLAWGAALLLATLPYGGRNLLLLLRLAHLIRARHRLVPPFPLGLWGDIYRAIARYQQRGRRGRKRQLRFTRRFREAANSIPDALIVLDKSRRIQWANPAADALMGVQWPRDDGKRLGEVLRDPRIEEHLGTGEYGRPLEIAPEHNQSLMLSVRIAPFGERKKQRLVVGRDITKVFHLNLIRRDFVANVSHELRTPLTVISGFLEKLQDSTQTPEPHRRPLELMRNQAERMRAIIEDLLTLSRLELSERVAEVATVAVPEELRLIVADARALSGDGHEFALSVDQQLCLLGNPAELHSVFSNLIFNAVKHTPPATRIEIAWQEDAQGPYFWVRDNGPGIAPEHLPRLSERFYRVDKARSRQSGGTGLGLAIVKHILQRHDASLLIASELGTGSTFTCRFPSASRLRQGAGMDSVPVSG